MHGRLGPNTRLDFLAGGGTMGALMRAHDWAATPLESAEGWSQALKTLVGVMLGSNQPMFIAWGPKRILLYNDAYAEILARKHPTALGRDFLEVWHEIKADLLPIVKQAYAGEPVHMDDITLMMERRGYPEETHFSFSYTPVRDETGTVAGFFCPCTEITGEVMAERRLAAETERQRRLFEQAPGFITVLHGPEHRFEFVNQAYSRLFGERAFVGKTVREAFPELEGQGFFEWLDQVYATGGRFIARHVPARFQATADAVPEERFLDFIYEPVKDEAGRVTGIFCEGHDVTEAYWARTAVDASNARYTSVLAAMGEGFLVLDEHFRVTEINAEGLRLDGRPESEILGRTHWELFPASLGTPVEAAYRRAMTERVPVELIHHYQDPATGYDNWLALRIYPVPGGVAAFYRDVSETKCAEEALRRSEERLAAIFVQASVGLSEVSLDGRFLHVNDELCHILGRSREELLRVGVVDVTHADDIPPSLAAVARAVETGVPTTLDKRYLRPEGTIVWANSSITRLSTGQGQSATLLVVTIDRTARHEAEAALRESEARFQAIANSIDQMVWSTRPDGYHDFFNQRWYDYTGVPEGSTDGAGWANIFHPDDQARTWAQWRHSLATGEPYHIEYRLRHRSGQYRWVLGRAQPVRDEQGRITRWFGTCTDIQEIVEAREVLARSREELERGIAERTAERDRIWQNSNELMGVFGFDGRRRAINPSWSRVLGYDEETLLNTPVIELTHPEDRPRLAEAIQRLANGERIVEFEDRLRHEDGSYRTISWTGVPGEDVFYGIGRDVTEYRRAEEALRQAQKMEAVGQLTGGVAHDFNNLLTIVRSSIEFLRRPNLPEERRTRYMDAISDTVDRASKLTGQLLAFARRQALKPEVFDVPERIRAVTDMLRTIVGARIQIVTDIACERCFVEADAAQFETALVNIVVNARDAMNGEGTLRIHVGALPRMPSIRGHAGGSGNFAAVSISDTGTGIPADKLAQIFEPFFTTKEVGKGTGLGLSQVYGFAKQSGGDVAVESKVGQGTTFTLYLPRTDKGVALGTEDDKRASGLDEEGRGHRVLVVEDNLEVGRFSTQLLQDLGYETTWAANAGEALKLLEEDSSRFDVVFSDVVMPGMSGIELGREIRRRYPNLPVVLTSGYSHVLAEEGRHGFELLHKPYAVEDVSRVLRRMTRTRGRDASLWL